MPVDRLFPTPEARELIALVRDIADKELAPRVDAAEAAGEYPRDAVRVLGRVGLLGLPYDEGGGQPSTRCTSRRSRKSPLGGRRSGCR